VCSLIFIVGCGNKNAPTVVIPNTTAQVKTYDNPAFSIQYPTAWNYQENVYGAIAMFFTPQGTGDQFRENVGIVTETLPSTMTVDEYYAIIKPQLQNLIKDYTELSNENITIDGLTGKKLIYEGTQVNYKLKWQQVFVIKDTTAYIINYTATADTFDQYIADVNAMVKTFALK
jgi:hypothetical protein